MVHWLFPASRYDIVTLTPCAGLREVVCVTVPDIMMLEPWDIWVEDRLMEIATR